MSHEITGPWRLKNLRYGVPGADGYGLKGEKCPHCETKIFPPRDICPNCNEDSKVEYVLLGKGEVYSYSTVYDAPEGHEDEAPYTVAIVKLLEGPMLTTKLCDVSNRDVFIGMPVEMAVKILRKQGDKGPIDYGIKFRPNMKLEITGWMDLLRKQFLEYEVIALSSR